jgi:hypothetical protein
LATTKGVIVLQAKRWIIEYNGHNNNNNEKMGFAGEQSIRLIREQA